MVAKVKSQVERLRDLDSSDVDGEEPAEEEGSTDSDDESPFSLLGRCVIRFRREWAQAEGCAITARE
jgi:hypothetical protein